MKLPSFLAFLTILGVRAQQQHEYLGFNVTTAADGDFALCGTNLEGCASLPLNARGCNVGVELGTLDELGTTSQQWIYQDGLLKPKVQPTHWYSTRQRCLGPKGAEELELGLSYPLTLQYCPEDDDDDDFRHMRFLMVDGRVQSLAHVVVPRIDDDRHAKEVSMATTPSYYCMSINSTVVMQSGGSAITLEPCDSQNMLQQGFQSYGTVQPFVYSLQDVWGYSDVVELAFAVGGQYYDDDSDADTKADPDAVVTLTIYNQRKEIVHSLQSTMASGILSFNVSDLTRVDGSDDTTATTGEYYIATLETTTSDGEEQYSVAFSVTAEESHVPYTCSTTRSSSTTGYLWMVLVGATPFIGLIVAACCHRSQETGIIVDEDEKTVLDDYDDDDEMAKAPKDNDDDASETFSQASTSKDSNHDSMELVSDQV